MRPQSAEGHLRRPALCRAAAPRRGRRSGAHRGRFCSTLPTTTDLPLVATNEVVLRSRDDYEAHDALTALPRARYVMPEPTGAGSRPEHHFKTRAADDGDVRRSARGDREHHRDRAPLRLSPGARAICRFLGRAAPKREGDRAEKERRRSRPACRGLAADGHAAAGLRCARPTRSGSTTSSTSSGWASGLLPDRRRLHPMGQGDDPGRAGPRLGRRLARRLGARPSPISTRCASGCCSSASSIPSACRCRTSTSTSARTAATR